MKQFTIRLSFAIGVAGALSAVAQTPPAPKPAPAATSSPATPAPATAPAATPAAPVDPNKVVLTVGDEKLTAAQFEQLIQAFPPQVQAAARGPQKRDFAEQFVQLKVVAQEAERRKIDQQPKVKQQIEIQRENLLAGLLFQELMSTTPVDEAAERKYYDAHKSEFEEAKAHHILIRFKGSPVPLGSGKKDLSDSEALAKAIEVRKELLAGKDFATVAKAESDDTGSAANGGDLGSFNRETMVKEFADAAFTLPIGQVSEPVRSQFGYHVIRVDSRQSKTFDQVKAELEAKVRPEVAKAQIDGLRGKANVMIDDSFFGPARRPSPAGPTK